AEHLDDDDHQREERHALDQRGGQDHRRVDIAGGLRLSGHALHRALGHAADTQGRADDHQPGADRLEIREGLCPRRLSVRGPVREEEQGTGQHDRLDPLHLNLDSLGTLRRYPPGLDAGNRPRPAGRGPAPMACLSSRQSAALTSSSLGPALAIAWSISTGHRPRGSPPQWGWTAVPMNIADKNVKM